jgi:hypothetical protein
MSDLQIAYAVIGALAAIAALVLAAHVIYRGLPNGKPKEALQKIIYELDRAADNMENQQKRQKAIDIARDALGWKKIIIPASIIGFIIDCEVAVVRKAQSLTNTPNLHEGENL